MLQDAQDETNIKQAVAEATEILRRAGIAEPRREAASLLAHALQRDRTFLLTHAEARVGGEELTRFRASAVRRAKREPLQYITGHQEFYKLDFVVTPDVLIPRPETELLVETALELLQGAAAPRILDVGTGSGCIVVSLLHEMPAARGLATDISTAALTVAATNAARYEVRPRLNFLAADGLSAFAESSVDFSIIVSNPPYIDGMVVEGLQPEVRLYEPRQALTPGADGMSMIRGLLGQAPMRLVPRGWLVFEIGFDQSEQIEKLIDRRVWELVAIRADLQGIPRTVVLQRN